MINPSAVTGSEECVLKSFNSFDMRSIVISRKYTSSSDISRECNTGMTPVARIRRSISSLFLLPQGGDSGYASLPSE